MSDDGQFLGTFSLELEDEDSMYSTFNELSLTPPRIMYNGRRKGYLTKNDKISGCIDPEELFDSLDGKKEVDWKEAMFSQ